MVPKFHATWLPETVPTNVGEQYTGVFTCADAVVGLESVRDLMEGIVIFMEPLLLLTG
jgi:hypothetical protein